MRVQEIAQTIFPSVLGKTKVFYYPRPLTSGNITVVHSTYANNCYVDMTSHV